MAEKQILSLKPTRDLNRSATNIPSACMIANIALDDAMILPYDAVQAGCNFRKGQMTVTRRQVSKAAAAVSATALLPRWAIAAPFVPATEAWRTFEITTRIEIANAQGPSQAWIPLPAVEEHSWTRPLDNKWTSNAKAIEERRVSKYGARVLQGGLAEGETSPIVEVTSRVMTRDRSVDLSSRAMRRR